MTVEELEQDNDAVFIWSWERLAKKAWSTSEAKGFHKRDNIGERLALIHSEISEALEAARDDNPLSEKIPEFSGLEEELADAVIRIMDFGIMHRLNIPAAILAKMQYNTTRPHMHGGRLF